MDISGIEELPLLPNEVFLLTRIDGTTDIKGLIAISQLKREETLHLMGKFLHHGFIQLHDPQAVREEIQQAVDAHKREKERVREQKTDKNPPNHPVNVWK